MIGFQGKFSKEIEKEQFNPLNRDHLLQYLEDSLPSNSLGLHVTQIEILGLKTEYKSHIEEFSELLKEKSNSIDDHGDKSEEFKNFKNAVIEQTKVICDILGEETNHNKTITCHREIGRLIQETVNEIRKDLGLNPNFPRPKTYFNKIHANRLERRY